MDEEAQLSEEMARGVRAKAILESGIFQEAVEMVEADTLEKWKKSPIRDEEGQRFLRLKWQALQEVKGYLKDVMETGKLASQTIEEKRNIAQRTRAAVAAFRR